MAATGIELIRPDWPAPAHVQAAATTRVGGFSNEPYASLNLGRLSSSKIAKQWLAHSASGLRRAGLTRYTVPVWLTPRRLPRRQQCRLPRTHPLHLWQARPVPS